MPIVCGRRLVINELREGEQTAWLQNALSNITPRDASLSMFGVLASLSPKQPIAGFKSSTQMSKMFGVFAEQNDVNCKANKKTNREKMFFTKISTWVIVGAWRSFPYCNQISFWRFQLLALAKVCLCRPTDTLTVGLVSIGEKRRRNFERANQTTSVPQS